MPPANNRLEARKYLDILDEVENEMTSIPYNPSFESDGRMYPPQDDSIREVPGHARVLRLRSVGHHTFLGDNGSIEIQDRKRKVVFRKAGADGKGVWDQ